MSEKGHELREQPLTWTLGPGAWDLEPGREED